MPIQSKQNSKRLTSRDRARRPARIALVSGLAVLLSGALGALLNPAAGIILALAVGTALVLAVITRDLGILRVFASEDACLSAIEPLRKGEIYPLNPASLCPENALTLAQEIIYRRPRNVLEFGSGCSTVFIGRCLEKLGPKDRQLVSMEHDAYWYADSARKLECAELKVSAQVHHAPLIENSTGETWYDMSVLPADVGPFDLVLVDGPEGGDRDPFARQPALDAIQQWLAPGATILLDDGGRPGEREVVERWLSKQPQLSATLHQSVDGMWAIQCPGVASAPQPSVPAASYEQEHQAHASSSLNPSLPNGE